MRQTPNETLDPPSHAPLTSGRPVLFARLLTVALLLAGHLAAAGPNNGSIALDQYLSNLGRTANGDGAVEVSIEASVSKLHKSAKLRLLQFVSEKGTWVFHPLHSEGDAMVRREVIARYLNAVVQAQDAPNPALAISPDNYRFLFQGERDYAGQAAYVYRLEAKRKRVGLFNGELWLDRETGAVLRVWGEFSKSPSRLIKRVYFVRDYAIGEDRSRSSAPRRLILNVSTRIFGQADMTIWYTPVSSGSEADQLVIGDAAASDAYSVSRAWSAHAEGGE